MVRINESRFQIEAFPFIFDLTAVLKSHIGGANIETHFLSHQTH